MPLRSFTDMMGRKVEVEYPPKRIVSLVPSQTELLYDLGLEAEVVGITKFCVHPESWFRAKKRVGGTKQLHLDKIRELRPDLVIANKEENLKEQIDELAKDTPMWISDIKSIDEGLQMIGAVGSLVNKEAQANSLVNDIASGFEMLQKATEVKRVAYFIWRDPWMSVGGDTFISNMIQTTGWKNVLSDMERYPEISLEETAAHKPAIVLLSSEPFPFREKHIAEVKSVMPEVEVLLVDGEMFSWYGSRMLKAIPYFSELIGR
ncbi:MAG: ABC transporter substrate-binding protein [Bacteroidetes bacterium]|nr:ABC transporter substrate-binding protein [Bacteroidota bacterium]